MTKPISSQEKLRRAESRGYFTSVDLFAGCGGMTLGFHSEGFRCVAAVELNDNARASHQMNFGRPGIRANEGYAAHSDILATPPERAVRHLADGLFSRADEFVDVVIGGPPCQAFSRLGRAALWDLAGKRYAHAEDERATMYQHFLRYVDCLRPIAFVMENVREIGKFVGRNIAEEVAATADTLGYETRYTILNAVWYGVPQLRERMFIIGISKELGTIPQFPPIEHTYTLPVGYSTSRAGKGHVEVLPPHERYVDHAKQHLHLRPAVTVAEAFADLPPITEHLDGRTGKGFRRPVHHATAYAAPADVNAFVHGMRRWPDFCSNGEFTGHVIRYTPRDYEIFRRMPAGGMFPEALQVAEQIFEERLEEFSKSNGRRPSPGEAVYDALRRATVPPYKEGRYPNKFRKMWADHPARTLPAHLGKDSYSHIHFDSEQARAISLREAARLQSFPDQFLLDGSMNAQLAQIGNAVPPMLARAVAQSLRAALLQGAEPTFRNQKRNRG